MKKNDLQILVSCDIFKGLSAEDVSGMIKDFGAEEKAYAKHEFIFTPEEYRSSLAVILKGSADVYKQTEKGPLFLSILGKGSVFGMAAMFYEKNGFINTVRAREDCRVLFLSRAQLERIFEKYPVCAANYITVLSEKIHYLNTKILYLTSQSPTGRLMSWLLNESERQNSDEIMLPVSYSELAMVLSLGRTSLYRSFDELTEQGKLIRDGKKITLIK